MNGKRCFIADSPGPFSQLTNSFLNPNQLVAIRSIYITIVNPPGDVVAKTNLVRVGSGVGFDRRICDGQTEPGKAPVYI